MSSPQIDNTYFDVKVQLRAENLPSGPVRVLDCFSGTGRIWNEVRRRCPGRDIHVTRIDSRRDLPGIYLRGDNRKYLASMNLDAFNVIDLDAYGAPFDQLELLFGRGQNTPKRVFVTMTKVCSLPYGMLEQLGYSRAMIGRCPSVFSLNIHVKVRNYLAVKGVREGVFCTAEHRTSKEYFCFDLTPELCNPVTVGGH